ncbi:hypothetical protein IMCC9480_3958 [Oxalobacteraceae bacterium IMCC9480]|nr:hypothetical protein IMCC9480_3958 [Oxalobacteraceae bacterium IMCC9480]
MEFGVGRELLWHDSYNTVYKNSGEARLCNAWRFGHRALSSRMRAVSRASIWCRSTRFAKAFK